jgi:peptidoglycan/LPS O-acetylase OafA/YrhL
MHQPGPLTKLQNIQALRGLAAMLVVLYHIAGRETLLGLKFQLLKPVHWFGFAGVDLFFVISGFIIASAHAADCGFPRQWPRYAFRRFWRVLPPYWIWLVGVASPIDLLFSGFSWERIATSPQLVPAALLVPTHEIQPWIPQAWTLSYELLFYAFFSLLILLPPRLGSTMLVIWSAVVAGLMIVPHEKLNVVVEHIVGPLVAEFLLGILAARIVSAMPLPRPWFILGLSGAWCTIAFIATYQNNPGALAVNGTGRVLVFGVPAMILLLAAVGFERQGKTARGRFLQSMGNASYSLYLTHCTTLVVIYAVTSVLKYPHTRLAHAIWILMMFWFSIAVGWGFYRWVERPLLNWGSSRQARPRRTGSSVVCERSALFTAVTHHGS